MRVGSSASEVISILLFEGLSPASRLTDAAARSVFGGGGIGRVLPIRVRAGVRPRRALHAGASAADFLGQFFAAIRRLGVARNPCGCVAHRLGPRERGGAGVALPPRRRRRRLHVGSLQQFDTYSARGGARRCAGRGFLLRRFLRRRRLLVGRHRRDGARWRLSASRRAVRRPRRGERHRAADLHRAGRARRARRRALAQHAYRR